MNKQRIALVLFLILSVGGALYFSPLLQSPFIHLSKSIKIVYLDQIEGIQKSFTKHLNQAETISELQEKNRY